MSSFMRTAAGVAVVTFIITMVVMAYVIRRNRYGTTFPPVIGECPDYWTASRDGKATTCHNTMGLGDAINCPNVARKGATITFGGPQWLGDEGACNKARWATGCGLTWDGITGDADTCE